MDAPRPPADWRATAPYAALRDCGRQAFAWEWLRRSPRYQAASSAADGEGTSARQAALFGLNCFEDADRAASAARPTWQAEADPYVLTAEASCEHGDDLFDVARFASLATCHIGSAGHEHWLFSDGWRHIRLDIIGGTLAQGPVRLAFRMAGIARLLPQLAALNRLVALGRTGRLAPALFPAERRAHRWALVLRTHDAIQAGASQREIAEVLFDFGELTRWRIEAPSYRRRVQRLVAAAHVAANADPRSWLSRAFP